MPEQMRAIMTDDDMNGLKGNIIPFGKHKGRLVATDKRWSM
jgi:hypothetical protein